MAHLRTLTDDELLRLARAEFDPLTSTDLEAELLRRFEECCAANAEVEPLLKVLDDHDIDAPAALEKALEFNAKFKELLPELETSIAGLQDLITAAQ